MVIEPGNSSFNNSASSAGRVKEDLRVKPSDNAENVKAETTSQESSVSLSSLGQTIAKIESELATSSEVDQEKVAQIKAAITSGQYSVDAASIADKIIAQDGLL